MLKLIGRIWQNLESYEVHYLIYKHFTAVHQQKKKNRKVFIHLENNQE